MIPERVLHYPDQETVDVNRSGNLTPDQVKVFREFSTSLKVRQTVDKIIYNKKRNCYLLQKSDVEAGEVISSEGEWDGSLLPFIDYRIYYLGDEKGVFENLLSAEMVEPADELPILGKISDGLGNALGYPGNDLELNKTGFLSSAQTIFVYRNFLKQFAALLFLYLSLTWPMLFPASPLFDDLWFGLQKMFFSAAVFIFTFPLFVYFLVGQNASPPIALGAIALVPVMLAPVMRSIPEEINSMAFVVVCVINFIMFGIAFALAGRMGTMLVLVVYVFPLVWGALMRGFRNMVISYEFVSYIPWIGLAVLVFIELRKIIRIAAKKQVKMFALNNYSDPKEKYSKRTPGVIRDFMSRRTLTPGLSYKIYYSPHAKVILNIEAVGISQKL